MYILINLAACHGSILVNKIKGFVQKIFKTFQEGFLWWLDAPPSPPGNSRVSFFTLKMFGFRDLMTGMAILTIFWNTTIFK